MNDSECTCDIRRGGCTCGAMERERAFRQAVADAPEKLAEAMIAAAGRVGERMGREHSERIDAATRDYLYNQGEGVPPIPQPDAVAHALADSLDRQILTAAAVNANVSPDVVRERATTLQDDKPKAMRSPGYCHHCQSLAGGEGRLYCRQRGQWLCDACYNAGEALERSGQPLHQAIPDSWTIGPAPEPICLFTKQQAAEMHAELVARIEALEARTALESAIGSCQRASVASTVEGVERSLEWLRASALDRIARGCVPVRFVIETLD